MATDKFYQQIRQLTDGATKRYSILIADWWDGKPPCQSCYVAGPMRGHRFFNYPEFLGAKNALERYGFRVLMADLTEEPNEKGHTSTPLKQFMVHDLPLLCQADRVFVLPGWEKSHGAKVEVHLAFQLDIPVYDIVTGRPIEEGPVVSGRHPVSARVHEVLREAGELHDLKARDYGMDEDPLKNVRNSEDFGVPAWVGCSIRLNDKVKRLQTMAQKGSLSNESAIDSFMDIIVYAAIGLVLFEETM